MREFLKKYDILGWTMSIAAALFLWMYVITMENPEMTVVKSVPLEVSGTEQLKEAGFTLLNDINSTITLQLRGRRDDIANLNKDIEDKIHAELNLGSIGSAGEYKLGYTVSVNAEGVTVAQKTPSQINVVVDEVISKTIPVEVFYSGDMPAGYSISQSELSVTEIQVTGAKKYVDSVAKAAVTIDRSDKTDSFEQTAEIKLYDSENEEINNKYITVDNNETVFSAQVKKTGEAALTADVTPFGSITADMIKVDISPKTIVLEGDISKVDATQSINLGTISLEDCLEQDKFEYVMPVKLPEGVNTDVTSMAATVTIEIVGMKKTTLTIPKENLPAIEGYEYVNEDITVTMFAENSIADNMMPEYVEVGVSYSEEEYLDGTLTVVELTFTSETHKIQTMRRYTAVVEKSVETE